MMNRIKFVLTAFAFALLVLGLPAAASAQYRDNDDDYYRQNRRGNNTNRSYLRDAVRRIEDNSRTFRRALDRELDNTRYDESRREDRINDIAEQFATAADNLEDSIDNGYNVNSSNDEAQRLFQLGNRIDNFISRNRFSSRVEREWAQIRSDLQTVANAYGYNNNGRGNRNNRRDRDDIYRDDDNNNRRNDNRRNRNRNGRIRLPF